MGRGPFWRWLLPTPLRHPILGRKTWYLSNLRIHSYDLVCISLDVEPLAYFQWKQNTAFLSPTHHVVMVVLWSPDLKSICGSISLEL